MAKSVDKITLLLKLKGFKAVKNLDKDFKKFTSTVKLTPVELDKAIKGLTEFNGNTLLSKKALEGQISALTRLKDSVGINTKAYQQLSEALKKAQTNFDLVTGAQTKQLSLGGKLKAGFKAGKGAALTGAFGRFLPPSAQIAGAAGFVKGGTAGAISGAALGLGVDAVAGGIQFARQAAIQASEVKKLQIALKGVTKDQETFEEGLRIISQTSKDLNVPIAASTKQFTTLSASVLGAGGNIDDARVVFEGVSNAIKATGGDAEDVQSAIRAMSQIFGKGKVSAEELQGQLGERLAGAVVKFAQANGSSLEQLQKDLRDGTVGLKKVITFANQLNIDFAKTARLVANSSADAGQRLKTQITNLSIAIGTELIPVGAALQKQFSEILLGFQGNDGALTALTESIKVFGGFLVSTVALVRTLVRTLVDLSKILFHIVMMQDFKAAADVISKGFEDIAINFEKDIKLFKEIAKEAKDVEGEFSGKTNKESNLPDVTGDKDAAKEAKKQAMFDSQVLKLQRNIQLKREEDDIAKKLLARQFQLIDATRAINETYKDDEVKRLKLLDLENTQFQIDKTNILKGEIKDTKVVTFDLNEEFRKLIKTTTDVQTHIGSLALDVTNKLGDAFADMVITGKSSFSELANFAITELGRIILKATFMKNIANPILGFLNLNADGNAIEKGEIVKSAKGNVFARNKIVPFAYGGAIVDRPTLFPMKNGAGLMGEAGPEAILPLQRGRSGKLGVVSQGGGVGNIVVNVDASGSSAEGDEEQSQAFGELLGSVVRTTIIDEQRPGGLLNS